MLSAMVFAQSLTFMQVSIRRVNRRTSSVITIVTGSNANTATMKHPRGLEVLSPSGSAVSSAGISGCRLRSCSIKRDGLFCMIRRYGRMFGVLTSRDLMMVL